MCGEGTRKRQVTCFSKLANGTIEELSDEDCADEKPAEEEPCQAETPCEATDWFVTDWSGCQDACGEYVFYLGKLAFINTLKEFCRAHERISRCNLR